MHVWRHHGSMSCSLAAATCPCSNRAQAETGHSVASRRHFCMGLCVLLNPHKSTAGLPRAASCLASKPSSLSNLTRSHPTQPLLQHGI